MKKIFKNLNKNLKLYTLFALIIFMATGLTSCSQPKSNKNLLFTIKERGKIIAGVKFDSKPFGFVDADQQLKGFDIDLVHEIAKRILGNANAVEFKQVTSSNRIFSLTSGAIDMVAATMTINEKRKRVIDFSEPYYNAGQAIMVAKGSNIRNVKDLNGKRVVVVLGSTSEQNIRVLAPDAVIKGFRTYTDAFSALKSGRADALTTDDTILAGFLHDDPNYKMLKERYTIEPYGIGFSKDKATESFQSEVNATLESMRSDGTLEKIRKRWMIESSSRK